MGEWIYLICYKGQTASSYSVYENDWDYAEDTMKRLQEKFPDREYYIVEKDVS